MYKVRSVSVLILFIYFPSKIRTHLVMSKNEYVLTPCNDNSDCEHLHGATCIDSICNCNGTKFCQDISNRIVTKIGEKCEHDEDCNIENSVCGEKKCCCKSGMVKSTDGRRCLLISDGIRGSCEDSVQCYTKTPSTGCQENKCVCQQHTHEYNGSCFRNVDLGQYCQSTGDCSLTDFSECINSRCTCSANYVASSMSSRCLVIAKALRSPCMDNAQCLKGLGAAECRDGFCYCKELHQLKESINKCVRDILLNEKCENNSECHGPEIGPSRLECILGVCKCKSSYVEDDGYCINSSYRLGFSWILNVAFLIMFGMFEVM